MADCNKCLYMPVCKDKTNAIIRSIAYDEDIDIECNNFKDKSDFVEVVHCSECVGRKKSAFEPFECTRNNMLVYKNCYCSFGIRERRNE